MKKKKSETIPNEWIFLDTITLIKKLNPKKLKAHNMQFLSQVFELEEKSNHSAFEDSNALREILKKLWGEMFHKLWLILYLSNKEKEKKTGVE